MPTEVEQHTYDHIGDAETVYMTHPDTEGVAAAPGLSFKRVWAKKGWTQVSRDDYEEHLLVLREQVDGFIARGDAVMPEDGDAQDIIMAERRGQGRGKGSATIEGEQVLPEDDEQPVRKHRGGAVSGGNV